MDCWKGTARCPGVLSSLLLSAFTGESVRQGETLLPIENVPGVAQAETKFVAVLVQVFSRATRQCHRTGKRMSFAY